MPLSELLCGLIFMLVLGPAVGNYATSVVYRLPRGQTPFEKHPFCGGCGTMLAPKDLFPILSYLWLKGRCRYCGMGIRFVYTAIEIACGAIFILNFLVFGISEAFILITAIGVFFTILCGLEWEQNRLYPLILTYLFALGAIWRTLQDGSLYPFVTSGFIMLMAAVAIWQSTRLIRRTPKAEAAVNASGVATTPAIPAIIWLAALMGVMLPLATLPYAAAAALALYGLQRLVVAWRGQSVAVGLAIYAMLLVLHYNIL